MRRRGDRPHGDVRPSRRRPARPRTLVAIALVGLSLVGARSGRVDDWDHRIGLWMGRPRGASVDRLVGIGTDLGSVYGLLGTSLGLASTGHRRLAGEVAVAGGVAWCVAQAAKPLVGRGRPYQTAGVTRLVAEPAGSSWPSGHAAVAAAMADTLAETLPRSGRRAAAAGVGAVILSRLYVGVHHPSDVIAGAGLGVLSARAARALRHSASGR